MPVTVASDATYAENMSAPPPRPRPQIVDAPISTYITAHSTPADEIQQRLAQVTQERTGDFAAMQIGADQGLFFEMLARAVGARSAIEVGTFTGYSALCIARGMGPEGRLICCDVSEEFTSIGRPFWEEAGVADRIDLRIGPALDTLASLPTDLTFDLVFIDADKPNYLNYYRALIERLTPTGIMLVDNTLWSGRVAEPTVDDEHTVAMREFNRTVVDDPRVRCVILPVGDGVTFIQRR
jgi:caffeoyl-CoA O-methyltransferase